jgi:hypothetical protein
MRSVPALCLAVLGLGCAANNVAAPADPATPPVAQEVLAAAPETPSPGQPPAPAEVPAIRPTGAEVPRDLTVRVERDRTGAHLRVERRGSLVALRRAGARAAGDAAARLDVEPGGTGATPIVWETTKLDTLETTRGTIGVGGGGEVQVAVAEAPLPVAEEAKRGHRCRAHEDGDGGFAVVCRTGPTVALRNLTSGAPMDGVTTVTHGATFVRLDLPAPRERPNAFVIAYVDGLSRVVIRAEASLVAGEEKASLALVSANRQQPAVVIPMRRFLHRRPEWDMMDF